MTSVQKMIKYAAMAFAIFLIVNIISAIIIGLYTLGNVFGLVSSTNETITEDLKVISGEIYEISTLKINVGFTNLYIKTGEKFRVETNNSNISYKENNGSVIIKEKTSKWLNINHNTENSLTVYLPKDMKALDEVKIENGAGTVNIDSLETQRLYLEVGAGKVHIEDIIATQEAKIDGGAGKIEIKSGKINNLDLNMGVGETIIQAEITGKSDIDAGIGNLEISLYGDKEDYKIDSNKGLGKIKIDNRDVTGDDLSFGYGENYIKIDGGVGNITVDFEQR